MSNVSCQSSTPVPAPDTRGIFWARVTGRVLTAAAVIGFLSVLFLGADPGPFWGIFMMVAAILGVAIMSAEDEAVGGFYGPVFWVVDGISGLMPKRSSTAAPAAPAAPAATVTPEVLEAVPAAEQGGYHCLLEFFQDAGLPADRAIRALPWSGLGLPPALERGLNRWTESSGKAEPTPRMVLGMSDSAKAEAVQNIREHHALRFFCSYTKRGGFLLSRPLGGLLALKIGEGSPPEFTPWEVRSLLGKNFTPEVIQANEHRARLALAELEALLRAKGLM